MFKLGCRIGDAWVEHSHPPVYSIGNKKVVATAPGSDPVVFQKLADRITPPFFLLYVLHTPRGEGNPGRYQSHEIARNELDQFLVRFERFLRLDSRFDLWLHSPADRATIVWDRHNLVHGYGPTESFVEALRALGFATGEPDISIPHQHNYHRSLDEDARAVLYA